MAFLRPVIKCTVSRKLSAKIHNINSKYINLSAPFQRIGSVAPKSSHASSAVRYDTDIQKSESQLPKDPLDLSFEDPEASFKSKTTWEVLRAYIVYSLCSSEYLVENNMKVRAKYHCCRKHQ